MISTLVAANDTLQSLKERADYICDGDRDEVEIQQAIDIGIDVELLAGTYNTESSLFIQGVDFNLARKAQLNIIADIDGLYISRDGAVHGGRIWAGKGLAEYSKSAIVFDGLEMYGQNMKYGTTGIWDTCLQRTVSQNTGNGIEFRAVTADPNDWAWGTNLRVHNVAFYDFDNSIFFNTPPMGVNGHRWFNGNIFHGLYFFRSLRDIYAPTRGFSGNVFTNLISQAFPGSQRALTVDCWGNEFIGWQVWDWMRTYPPALEFGPISAKNIFIGALAGADVLDLSAQPSSNYIHDIDRQTHQLEGSNGQIVFEY